MVFRVLLWSMGILYKRAARKNEKMKAHLGGAKKTIQFTTKGNPVSRFFRFSDESVFSQKGESSDADMTIRFESAETGFQVMWSMARGKDKNAFMRGIQEKTIEVEGDVMQLMWFQKSVRYLF